MKLTVLCGAILLLLAQGTVSSAAGAESDTERFFDPSRLLTSGGLLYRPSISFSLEPMIGLDYRKRLEEVGGGMALSTHKLHAEAGGTMKLFERFSLSTAAKIPVTTLFRTGNLSGHPGQDSDWRISSDLKQPGSKLGWRSEVGVKLAPQLDLNLFFDQTLLGRTPAKGGEPPEESFGTRFIIRFK